MSYLARLGLSLGLVLASAASMAQTAAMPDIASYTVGDRWEWKQTDNRTHVVEAKFTRSVVLVRGALQFFDGTARYDIVAEQTTNHLNDASTTSWRVWPLEVGKTWSFDGQWHRSDGLAGATQQAVKVVAYEEVTVPAGTFMAFRIEHRGFFRNANGTSAPQIDTYWYAPAVKADVRHVKFDSYNDYTQELLSFQPGVAGQVDPRALAAPSTGATPELAARFVGQWTMDVDSFAVQRAFAIVQDGDTLVVAFGYKQPKAKLRQIESTLDGFGLLTLRTGSDSIVSLRLVDATTLKGTFTNPNGKVLNATAVRATQDSPDKAASGR